MALPAVPYSFTPIVAALGAPNALGIPVSVQGATGIAQTHIPIDQNGIVLPVESGGLATAAAAAATATAVKTSAGRLCKVMVTALGTAAVNIYDNASAASGTVICAIPASAPVGSIYDVQMPCVNGIYVGGTTNTPALTLSYS